VVAVAAAAAPERSAAAPSSYVALGDSFSAGEGLSPYLGRGNECDRSSRAYSAWVRPPGFAKPLYAVASGGGRPDAGGKNLFGSKRNVRSAGHVGWASWACSGAMAQNVLPRRLGGVPQAGAGGAYDGRTQLDSASLAGADLVTLTLGGNDAGYIEVLVSCGLANCHTRAFERSRAAMIDAVKPKLEAVYRAIGARAPHARILVLGYPQLFPATRAEQACGALAAFRGEQNMVRRLGVRLNDTIRAAVAAVARSGVRIEYVPATARFAGHEVCGRKGAWMNGLVLSSAGFGIDPGSFHPNLLGQREGYAAIVDSALARG